MKLTVKRFENSANGELYNLTITPSRLPVDHSNDRRGEFARNASSISRALSTIKEVGLSNDWDYFVTFTVRDGAVPDVMDVDSIAENIGRRCRHIREDYPGFSCGYILIPEIHPEKRERIHFHGFIRDFPPGIFYRNKNGYLSCRPFDTLGFQSFSKVTNTRACVLYCLKYVCKDLAVFRKNDKTHLYYRSRGLKRFEQVENEFYTGTERLLFEAGFNYNEDYNFFSLKELPPEVAAVVLEHIKDEFLLTAYARNEVHVDEQLSIEINRDFHPCGTDREGWKEFQLFDL